MRVPIEGYGSSGTMLQPAQVVDEVVNAIDSANKKLRCLNLEVGIYISRKCNKVD
jgi:hypothetical protein